MDARSFRKQEARPDQQKEAEVGRAVENSSDEERRHGEKEAAVPGVQGEDVEAHR